jgi:polysaccharide biosynthesis/export protein
MRLNVKLKMMFLGLCLALVVFPVDAQTISAGNGGGTSSGGTKKFDLLESTSAYRLGPGDVVEISVQGMPEMTTNRSILTDGTITLPMIGSVRLSGLSQEQASQEITELYRSYLKTPATTVAVVQPRPLNVTVLGEVNRPGPYTLGSSAQNQSLIGSIQGTSTKNGTGSGSIGGAGGGRLTVSQALSLAGGVTEVADVENITLVRAMPGGQKSRIAINLWAMIQNADTSQDKPLLDGDALVIPKAAPGKANYDSGLVNTTTFAPSTVEVKVVGEVNRPGFVSVVPGAVLTDALVAAGGLTDGADPKSVQLLRLNADGSVTGTELEARLEQGRSSEKNPSLRKGDLIRVQRSFGSSVLKTVQDIANPLYLFTYIRSLLGR